MREPDSIKELGGIENLGKIVTKAADSPSTEIFQELLPANEGQIVVGGLSMVAAAVVAQKSASLSR